MLFKKNKKKNVNVSTSDSEKKSSNDVKQYIVDQCEHMIEIAKDVIDARDEYNVVSSYLNDVKVGYAANSERICCHLTSKARGIQIPEIAYAEYVLYFAHRYHIARIIR